MTTCGCEIMIMREPSISVIVARRARPSNGRHRYRPPCRCGTDHSALIRAIEERENQLPDKSTHTWHHDAQDQAEQHRQDEAVYSEDSPWRYNDVTSGLGDDKERWNKT